MTAQIKIVTKHCFNKQKNFHPTQETSIPCKQLTGDSERKVHKQVHGQFSSKENLTKTSHELTNLRVHQCIALLLDESNRQSFTFMSVN